ncbi:aminomethyl-transferring glycine dehydrogenase subunit GcvPA [Polyangium sp. 6x1]|uniref:aminomethyl-transferring glycine dehydrogenase subunit GcvPA n=1 Tax=Polyangium sp. 6x1 TaxID=3042689 RepID=UPI0024827FE4|nr:aminomethyl-transferring glycine dehydrogenase subunit GcvPA [Polyangium sp. 6x1]MDI1445468.1 aminomethyl-transferring glycine dehydrogenase subunit GcvPA [Polyangium sp. 6x1]
MRYLPHTPEEIASMLEAVGLPSLEALYESIPARARYDRPLDLPAPVDEPSLMRHLEELARKNRAAGMLSFLGAGAYEHHFPPAADQLILRSEFYTAYTPYQPEVAQGTLQVIYEFQTIVSEIFGLPLANASMYDGASAAAEAVLMARRLVGREHTVISAGIHPEYLETIETHVRSLGTGKASLTTVPLAADGAADVDALAAAITNETACVVVGYPNFYGSICDLRKVAEAAHAKGALVITATEDPYALALLESPGALGADIAVGEGQPLGLPPQFGGPGVGLFACRDDRKYLQQIPGRIVGETVDKEGNRGYVLTLATREQHIRRERATSNICTNSGLCATAMTIKMCMLGKKGFVEAARQCLAKAEYLKKAIAGLEGYALPYSAPTFNEFVVRVRGGDAKKVCDTLATREIIPGFDLGRISPDRKGELLIAVTERHTRADLDRLVEALASI